MVEETKTEVALETETPETTVTDEKTPTLEQERDALEKEMSGEEPSPDETKGEETKLEGEEKPKEEVEETTLDWDELCKKYDVLEKLNIDSPERLAESFANLHPRFQKDSEVIAALKKRGVDLDTPEGRREFLNRVEGSTGADLGKVLTPETGQPQNFQQARRQKIEQAIKENTIKDYDPVTGEEITRKLKPEELKAETDKIEGVYNQIFPIEYAQAIEETNAVAAQTNKQYLWDQYQVLKVIKEKFKDEILPDSTQDEIMKFFDPFPATAQELIKTARKNGKNPWEALHQHFLSQTKKSELDEKRKKKQQEQVEKEASQRLAAKTETKSEKEKPLETTDVNKPEVFKNQDLKTQRDWLQKNMGG